MSEFFHSGRARFHADLAPLMQEIDDVQPAPFNYNNGDVDMIVESILTSGMYRPIYVRKETGDIIAGNHTWMACKELGSHVIPVVTLDVDEPTAKRLMVSDNEIARRSLPDTGLLLSLLNEIEEPHVGTGLSEEEIKVMTLLNDIPLDLGEDSFAQWPTFSARVPPHALRAFHTMTAEAGDDRAKFELMLRLAGWDGKA